MNKTAADNIKDQSMEILESKEKHSETGNSCNVEESKNTAQEYVNLNVEEDEEDWENDEEEEDSSENES